VAGWTANTREFVRAYGGWLLGLGGVLLCALGWYGVSGERHEARQVPYLASATIPGAALIVAGAVLVVGAGRGAGSRRASDEDVELRLVMARLYGLLTEPATAEGAPVTVAAPDAPWVAVPGGARYHRPGCSLVRGKNGVYAVDAAFADVRDLRPCRLCDPGSAASAEAAPGPARDAETTGDAGTGG